jgi:hypothetical protein
VPELVAETLKGLALDAEVRLRRAQLPKEATNGAAATPDPSAAKSCTLCGETKPAASFAASARRAGPRVNLSASGSAVEGPPRTDGRAREPG